MDLLLPFEGNHNLLSLSVFIILTILTQHLFTRIATDIVEERLLLAKQLGADVLINGLQENLQGKGM